MSIQLDAPGLTYLWQAATEILGPSLNPDDYKELAFNPSFIRTGVTYGEPLPSSNKVRSYVDPVFYRQFGIETDVRFTRMITPAPDCVEELGRRWREYEKTMSSKPSKEQRKTAALFEKCIYGASIDGNDAWTNKYSIKWINDQIGYGLFASKEIKAGSVIGYYAGLLTDKPIDQNYCFGFDGTEFEGLHIDGSLFGNAMRYLNHTPEQFANVKTVEYCHAGLPFVMFVAKKDIHPGEAMLYDYGDAYWQTQGIIPKILQATGSK